MRSPFALGALLSLALALPSQAALPDDLCAPAADPCVVNSAVTLPAGAVVDVGMRALQLGANARLIVSGTVVFRARDVRLLPGARITGTGTLFGASVEIHAVADIRCEAAGSLRSRIDVSASTGSAGSISLDAGGRLVLDGDLLASATGPEANGGLFEFVAGGDIAGNGSLELRGGSESYAGNVFLRAGGAIDLGADVALQGGDLGGGDLDLKAAGDVTTRGAVNVKGGGVSGDGGSISMTASGAIRVLGSLTGDAAGDSEDGGGTGASVTLLADQSVDVSGQLSIPGAAPDGSGGDLTIEAGTDVTLTAPIIVAGNGIDGCGGSVEVSAGRHVSLERIDATGGSCDGGTVFVDAVGDITATQVITAEPTNDGGSGGVIALAGRGVTTVGILRVSASPVSFAGTIEIDACTVNVTGPSELRAIGPLGLVELHVSGQATVAGRLLAQGGSNRLVLRAPVPPPIVTGTITPAAPWLIDPTLPPCPPSGAICGNGAIEGDEQCDDGGTAACDGCSPSCGTEGCGNGRVECDEECDAGPLNGTPGSGCNAQCRVVVAGGGIQSLPGARPHTGCFLEWALRNPGGEVVNGFPSRTQRCIDGDPGCDGDRAINGSCAFELAACLAPLDPRFPTCTPAAIDKVTINTPHLFKVTAPVDVANAQALVAAASSLGVTVKVGSHTLQTGIPNPQRGVCTDPFAFVVPHEAGVEGRKAVDAGAHSVGGTRMTGNKVTLACEPNPAVCGNGTLEIGEECDDHNTASCDGCTSSCRREICGDGVVQCGEQCDDGPANGAPQGQCSATCTQVVAPLRIPGGGSKSTDCAQEFALAHAAAAVDRKGLPLGRQSCVDGDPACDLDPTPGVCGWRLWVCLGAADPRLACGAATVMSVEVQKPSSKEAGLPAQLRQALLQRLAALPLPAGPGERCTQRIELAQPAGGKQVALKLRAVRSDGQRDSDTLKLRCLAAP